MNPTDLNRTLRQPQRYWNIDGLPLLGMGAFWLMAGAVQLVMPRLHGQWKWAGAPLPFLLMAGCFSLGYILKRLKARITEPRTGYIRVSRQNYWAPRILGG